MYVKVRTIDGKTERAFDISKLISIEDFKNKVSEEFSIEPDLQRLFYRGKQLENGYTIFHYGVGPSDVLQLVVRTKIREEPTSAGTSAGEGKAEPCTTDDSDRGAKKTNDGLIEAQSPWCRISDEVDCLDRSFGAWFEATVFKILRRDASSDLIYKVQWKFIEDNEPFDVAEDMIRPRARKLLSYDELDNGLRVMINYNTESPNEDGFWFDFTIAKIKKTRTSTELTGTLHVGGDHTAVENCKVNPRGEIYAIEEKTPLDKRDDSVVLSDKKRRVALICKTCNDDPNEPCKDCGCCLCSGKQEPHNLLLCDECNKAHHLRCLVPPLDAIPDDDNWYCPSCKNDENEIVKAGDKLKPTKKRMTTTELKRGQKDWGMGMACLGRMAECTIVPQNHVGPIPGIEVGMSWEYRLQVSESGVHRPHVAGIHGREGHCAYSIVLSGGYEDDVDYGDEFMYTGSGGRDLSGNKRTAVQSCDQTLTRMNKALALNCSAKLNTVKGATATNWRDGKPVRVVRSCKLRKHSKYAPVEGNRYDGIYKVVKYFPEKGKSGFSVWRYLLRRDDPTPAPWTTEGKKRMESLGLKLIRYKPVEAAAADETSNERTTRDDEKLRHDEDTNNGNKAKSNKRKSKVLVKVAKSTKRPAEKNEQTKDEPKAKKSKRESYKLDESVVEFIKLDTANSKLWDECCNVLADGKIAFLQIVTERYTCVCCQEVVRNPVTTPCAHNICLTCMKRSFRAGVHCCPMCRHEMKKNYQMVVNESLSSALKRLLPGYGGGR